MITVYTDGSCNLGFGGWGFLIVEEKLEVYAGEFNTTNNRMELTAAIEALEWTSGDIQIYTDSLYLQKGITCWIQNWKMTGWKKIKNTDLWQKLDQLVQNRNVVWTWVKAHNKSIHNERADRLANLGRCISENLTKKVLE